MHKGDILFFRKSAWLLTALVAVVATAVTFVFVVFAMRS